MTFIKRTDLGRPLTWDELDSNFQQVDSYAAAASASASAAQTQAQSASQSAQQALQSQQAAETAAASAEGVVDDFKDDLASPGGAGMVGGQLAATGSVYRTQAEKNTDAVSVKDFGAKGDGVTDDTAAIQRAIDYVRASVVTAGTVLRVAPTLLFPFGSYRVTSSLNMSGFRNHAWRIVGEGATLLGETNGTPVVDLMGTRYFDWHGLCIVGSTTNTPNYGVILGRTFANAGSSAGEYEFNNCTFYGTFTRACLYTLAPEVVQYSFVRFWNKHASFDSYCVIIDTDNNENITSAFQNITLPPGTPQSCNENTFITCDFRKDISGDCILYRGRGGSRHKFINSYAATVDGSAVFLKEAVWHQLLQLDMHVETSGAKRTLLIDNETSVSNIAMKGLRIRDHNPQCSESLINVTGTKRAVLFDDLEIDVGTPAQDIPIFGGAAGSRSKFLVSGRIKWRSTRPLDLSNCQIVGELIIPESTFSIVHTIGSYKYISRPDSANGFVVRNKGTSRFIGNSTGLLGSESDADYIDITGGSPGAVPIIQVGGVSADISMRLRAKGSGSIDLQGGDASSKLRVNSTGVGFQGNSAIEKPTVTGSRAGNAALASLIAQLVAYGLIIDGTTT